MTTKHKKQTNTTQTDDSNARTLRGQVMGPIRDTSKKQKRTNVTDSEPSTLSTESSELVSGAITETNTAVLHSRELQSVEKNGKLLTADQYILSMYARTLYNLHYEDVTWYCISSLLVLNRASIR